jgi:hypothetical protein
VEDAVQDTKNSVSGSTVASPKERGVMSQNNGGGGGGGGSGGMLAVLGNAMSVGLLGSLILSPATWAMLRDAITRRSQSKHDESGHPVVLDCGIVADAARIEAAHKAGFSFLRKAVGNCTPLIDKLQMANHAQVSLLSSSSSAAQPRPTFRDSVASNFPRQLPALSLALTNHRRSTDKDLMLDHFIMQPLYWLDMARGGEDACSISLMRDIMALRQMDVRRQSKALRLTEMMVSDIAELTTPPGTLPPLSIIPYPLPPLRYPNPMAEGHAAAEQGAPLDRKLTTPPPEIHLTRHVFPHVRLRTDELGALRSARPPAPTTPTSLPKVHLTHRALPPRMHSYG